MESWLSGLRRTTGNRVWGDTSPRVQIPDSPPNSADLSALFLFPTLSFFTEHETTFHVF